MGFVKELLGRLFSGKHQDFVDFRDEEESHAESVGYSDASLGSPQIDELVAELVSIGQGRWAFTSNIHRNNETYDELGRHRRSVQIGQDLYELGGVHLMEAAYHRVRSQAGPLSSNYLQTAWHGVGEWLA